MEERVAMLEKDVTAIKSELAVIHSTYWMREDAKTLNDRVSRIEDRLLNIEIRLARLEAELEQLKADVLQLKTDVATLRTDLTALTHRFDSELPHLATKADLYQFEARMKAWGIGLALSVITINTGINFAMYSSLKSQMVAQATQGAQPPLASAPAARKP